MGVFCPPGKPRSSRALRGSFRGATCGAMQLTKHWAAQLDDYAIDLAWSPDGAQLAAASAAGPISLFASVSGAKQHELPGHDNGTNCIAWKPSADPTVAAPQPLL